METFKCQNCNRKFKIDKKSYFNGKIICQKCYDILREDSKTERNREKRLSKK